MIATAEKVRTDEAPRKHARFPNLLSPLTKGRLSIRNRVMMSGHMTLYSTGGMVGPRLVRYYAERAAGGVGIIVTEASAVHPTTVKFPEMMCVYDHAIVPWLDTLGDAIHEHGAKIIIQLAHGGARMSALDSDLPLYAPSAQKQAMYNEVPRAMTPEEIVMVQEGYAASAANVGRSRADGVEIHSGHGYLPVQFLSPLHNQRTDSYGGSLENRARFLLETLTKVRRAIGERKLIGLKLNGEDASEGGLTVDDYVAIAKLVEQTGIVDYINVTVGTAKTNHLVVPAMPVEEGVNVANAAKIRAAVDIPVFPVGRIYRPEHAESIIADGSVDGVALARALIADPDWVRKAENDPSRIRPCIAVNQGCFGYLYRSRPITCLVNPRSGKEAKWGTKPARELRRIAVVGGGPAGCEAALTAAGRGHDVTLFEQNERLGGLLNHAASVESRRNWEDFLIFQRSELSANAVDVQLGVRADADMLSAEGYDAVVLALGAQPGEPSAPGAASGPAIFNQITALGLTDVAGRKIVLIDEVDSMEAYVPAEHLARSGAEVTVVTAGLSAGGKLDQPSLVLLMERFARLGITLKTSTRLITREERGVRLADVWSGRDWHEPCTHLVIARDRVAPARTLAERLAEGNGPIIREIGDSLAPRSALEAVREGRLVGEDL
ncbi:MAG TPA: FAD-dependent oxidoreductase [Rhizobiaceae bacterium]|nr:FAD-dependent oxidoreductase [Rhizobiaceae bacterium]